MTNTVSPKLYHLSFFPDIKKMMLSIKYELIVFSISCYQTKMFLKFRGTEAFFSIRAHLSSHFGFAEQMFAHILLSKMSKK